MNAAELVSRMLVAKREIDESMTAYEDAIIEDAEADRAAKVAHARAYLTCREQLGGKATVPAIEAAVDLETAEIQKDARLKEGLKRSAGQAVESRRQWLSALQSLSSLEKAEMQLAKWEPSETRTA